MQNIKIGIMIAALAALIGGSLGIQAHAYTQGWYTLFQRHHCTQGEDNCFCNNPNDCQLQFTNNPNTNERLLKDFINSRGNGHFIPSELQDLFTRIQNSIQSGDNSQQFQQCLEFKHITGTQLSCRQLVTQGETTLGSADNGGSLGLGGMNLPAGSKIIIVPGNTTGPILQQQQQGQGEGGEYGR